MRDMREVIEKLLPTAVGNDRGVALIVVALGLTAFLGVAALALDLGMLYTARTESQRVADGAALAGAAILFNQPTNEAGARQEAKTYAAMNNVRGEPVSLQDSDVEVFLNIRKVRVTVRHIDGGLNGPIPTYFARILGFDQAEVVTVAAAQVYPSLGLECILPLALPDKWCEEGSPCSLWPDPMEPDTYDPANDPADWYQAWDPDPMATNQNFTGYSDSSVGDEILIKPGSPGQAPQPGWFQPFRIPGTAGANVYKEAICDCMGEGVDWGDELEPDNQPGNMVGPTNQGFQCLYDKDPDAYWDESLNDGKGCVTHPGASGCEWSDRIRPMVMYDPNDQPDQGMNSFPVSNYVGVFLETRPGGSGQNDIWVRFVEYMGVDPSDQDVTVPGPNVMTIRLVE